MQSVANNTAVIHTITVFVVTSTTKQVKKLPMLVIRRSLLYEKRFSWADPMQRSANERAMLHGVRGARSGLVYGMRGEERVRRRYSVAHYRKKGREKWALRP